MKRWMLVLLPISTCAIACAESPAIEDPIADYTNKPRTSSVDGTGLVPDRTKRLMKMVLDIDGDGYDEQLLSQEDLVDGQQGNIWDVYAGTANGYVEVGQCEVHPNGFKLVQFTSETRGLLVYGKINANSGLAESITLNDGKLSMKVLEEVKYQAGENEPQWGHLFVRSFPIEGPQFIEQPNENVAKLSGGCLRILSEASLYSTRLIRGPTLGQANDGSFTEAEIYYIVKRDPMWSNITVSVDIVDSTGKRIAGQALPPSDGLQSYHWNGQDQEGVSVLPGLYRIVLNAKGVSANNNQKPQELEATHEVVVLESAFNLFAPDVYGYFDQVINAADTLEAIAAWNQLTRSVGLTTLFSQNSAPTKFGDAMYPFDSDMRKATSTLGMGFPKSAHSVLRALADQSCEPYGDRCGQSFNMGNSDINEFGFIRIPDVIIASHGNDYLRDIAQKLTAVSNIIEFGLFLNELAEDVRCDRGACIDAVAHQMNWLVDAYYPKSEHAEILTDGEKCEFLFAGWLGGQQAIQAGLEKRWDPIGLRWVSTGLTSDSYYGSAQLASSKKGQPRDIFWDWKGIASACDVTSQEVSLLLESGMNGGSKSP